MMLEATTLGTISAASAAGASAATVSTAASVAQRIVSAAPALPTEPPSFWSQIGFSGAGGQVMEFFMRGGPFMWPILIASFIAAVYLIDRLLGLSSEARATAKMLKGLHGQAGRTDLAPEELQEECVALCEQFHKSPVATMAIAGLEKLGAGQQHNIEDAIERAGHAEMVRLERGLPALASVSNIAPLIGFLGTVWGIIIAFHIIGLKKVVNPQDISEGISQALIMSAAGLSVAIPAAAAYNFFAGRVSRIAVMMQEGAYLLTLLFSALQRKPDVPGEDSSAEESEAPDLPEEEQK